jgi:phage terminase small subunit
VAKLRGKRQSFVNEYLKDFNATEAYKRAGYKCTGHAATASASEILTNLDVQAAIAAAQTKVEKRTIASLERLEQELERLALSDVRKLFNPDGAMVSPAEWDDDTAAAIGSVEIVEEFEGRGKARTLTGYTKKVKCWDKGSAIVALLKRRQVAADGELGSKNNPIHHRIGFIEFADVDGEALPGASDAAGQGSGPAVEPKRGPKKSAQ